MANTEQNRVTIKNVSPFEVRNVRSWKDVIYFSLAGGGLYISGCRVVKGKEGDFIGWPQQKGKDDQYYTIARLYLTQEAEADLIKRVKEAKDETPFT